MATIVDNPPLPIPTQSGKMARCLFVPSLHLPEGEGESHLGKFPDTVRGGGAIGLPPLSGS